MMPTQPAPTETRPLSSECMAIEKPWPSSPSSALAGTFMSVKYSSAVAWPRRPSLPWISRASKPGVSVGTRKADTPFGPGPPVRAKTRHRFAQVPLVMKIFDPLMM